jgi:AcrR family transcriptional regulator
MIKTKDRSTASASVRDASAEDIHEGMAQHIARVAARLFAEHGYDATPVRTIVEAAGVTKPTLYYHFGSKEGLAEALLTVPMTRLSDRVRELLDSSVEPQEIAAEMIEAHFAFAREEPDRARFVFALSFGPLGSSLAPELARFCEALTVCWDWLAKKMAVAGLLRADRANACAANLRGVMLIHTLDFLYRGGELGPKLARRLVGDMLHGFALHTRDRGRVR